MSKFYQVSKNHFIDESFRLLTKASLPRGTSNQYVYVPPYLELSSNDIIGFNINKADYIRHYEYTNSIMFNSLTRLTFLGNDKVCLDFITRDKKRHRLVVDISVGVTNTFTTVFALDDNLYSRFVVLKDIKPLTDLRVCTYTYTCKNLPKGTKQSKSVNLSVGLSSKKFAIKYDNTDLGITRRVFFYKTWGIILDSDLKVSGVVLFDDYNNKSISVNKFIFLTDAEIGKAILLRQKKHI